VGIGADMDANFRPVMTSYDQFAAIDAALAHRGFSAAETDRILGGNAVALIRRVCG
jgi:membrane dipeptidase